MAGRTCPYCRFPIKQDTAAAVCPTCGSPHHEECWADNQGCAITGCASGPQTQSSLGAESPSQPAQAPTSQPLVARVTRATTPATPSPPVSPPVGTSSSPPSGAWDAPRVAPGPRGDSKPPGLSTPAAATSPRITLIAAAVAALVVGVAAGYILHSSSSSSSPPAATYAPPKATRDANATFNAPKEALDISAGFGSLWVVAGGEHAAVDRYEATNDAQRGPPISVRAYARHIVVAPTGVWVSSQPNVQRIDPTTDSAQSSIDLNVNIDGGLTAAGGSIWDLDFGATTGSNIGNGTSSVTMVTEESGDIVGKVGSLPACPGGVAPGDNAVYVFYNQCNRAQGVARVDQDGSFTYHNFPIGGNPSAAESNGILWITNAETGTITPTSPTTLRPVGASIYIGNYPSDVTSTGGYLWVAMGGDNQVVQFDPRRRVVIARIAVGTDPSIIAAEGSHVWTYNAGRQTISRIDF
jgi:hypothetical protein